MPFKCTLRPRSKEIEALIRSSGNEECVTNLELIITINMLNLFQISLSVLIDCYDSGNSMNYDEVAFIFGLRCLFLLVFYV